MLLQKDILTPMAEALIAHPEIVGVAPFLTEDSLPKTWPQLYKKKGSGPNDLNDVNFLDNLATLWRAEWCATHKPRRSLPPPLRSTAARRTVLGRRAGSTRLACLIRMSYAVSA